MRLNKEIAKNYYTAAQARNVLGLDEQALQYWVRKGRIHKTILPGMSQGRYLKKEVDDMAEQIEAAIIAQTMQTLEFRKATIDDLEEEYKLARVIFGRRADTPEIRQGKRAFLAKNPDIDYHLYDEGMLVGCTHIVPLKHETIMTILNGNVTAWLVDPENVEPFEPGRPVECLFLDTLTTPGVEPVKRSGYAAYMLSKLARQLTEMGSRGIEISKAYGMSRTPSGIRILKSAGFQIMKEYEDGKITFEMDIATSTERILRRYQEALAEWKAKEEKKRPTRRKTNNKESRADVHQVLHQ